MSKVKDETYIVIQSFMVNELNLKGNELIIYAIIYGFSQAENQTFSGSLQYLADWTNCTKQGVIKILKSLVDKGFIVKKENVINNVKFCEYYSTKFNTLLNKVEYPIKQSLPNNINNNINNNIFIKKKNYGEFENVLLTDKEYQKLIDKHGKSVVDDYIEKVSGYCQSSGKKYKDYYATVQNWLRKDKPNTKSSASYSIDDIKKNINNFD